MGKTMREEFPGVFGGTVYTALPRVGVGDYVGAPVNTVYPAPLGGCGHSGDDRNEYIHAPTDQTVRVERWMPHGLVEAVFVGGDLDGARIVTSAADLWCDCQTG